MSRRVYIYACVACIAMLLCGFASAGGQLYAFVVNDGSSPGVFKAAVLSNRAFSGQLVNTCAGQDSQTVQLNNWEYRPIQHQYVDIEYFSVITGLNCSAVAYYGRKVLSTYDYIAP